MHEVDRQKSISGARCDSELISALDACTNHANDTAVGLRGALGKNAADERGRAPAAYKIPSTTRSAHLHSKSEPLV